MDYFSILNLRKEPFSNSPDPAFFYRSRQHVDCLQKLELSIRTRRGLSVVVGDVGTGKTTLCRELIRRFGDEEEIDTHLILDPGFSDGQAFLRSVVHMMEGGLPPEDEDEWQLKERIKTHLFRRGVDEKGLVVLIVDEGQKIPDFCLEMMREFLNFETNEYKLLQIVIFAQREFEATLAVHANFADRISLFHHLGPLNFADTRSMIRFRIRESSPEGRPPSLFTPLALWRIYRCSGGYPRKIVNICHQSLLAMIIQNRRRAGVSVVEACDRRSTASARGEGSRWLAGAIAGGAAVLVAVVVAAAWLWSPEWIDGKTGGDAPLPAEVRVDSRNAPLAPETGDEGFRSTRAGGGDAASLPSTLSPPGPALALMAPVPPVTYVETLSLGPRTVPDEAPSGMLGVVRLKKGETLSWMCVKIYGAFDSRILRMLQKANSGMGNPKSLSVNQSIRFPAIRADASPPDRPVWWLRLGSTSSLGEALEQVREFSSRADPVRIVPYRSAESGLRFAVIFWRYYHDEAAARSEAARLHTQTGQSVSLHSEWGQQPVFFADPYRGSLG
ncbi:MAG: AAA family ATPase [Desulfobacteraceae bacterium]|nr:AAA family ATPase [Desulfobacteraceae bacterium]